MPLQTVSYDDILKSISEESIKERFLLLYSSAINFLAHLDSSNEVYKNRLFVSKLFLQEAVLNYFSDIIRLKNFHEIEKIETRKVASYTAYWILRCRPIQLCSEPDDNACIKGRVLSWPNEAFACATLISMTYNTSKPLVDDWSKFNQFTSLLRYNMTYRLVTPQILELSLYGLDANSVYESL
jgi:hypothetical protein